MHRFRELKIGQRRMDLAENVYRVVAGFPTEEKYGLTPQLKRCAVSVPANISEGAGRATNKQFKFFLEVAMGSCNEVQTQMELAKRFGYVQPEQSEGLVDEAFQLYKMILVFYNSLSEA